MDVGVAIASIKRILKKIDIYIYCNIVKKAWLEIDQNNVVCPSIANLHKEKSLCN